MLGRQGRQLAVVFSRQSGKDEALAQVIAYLMYLHRLRGGSIVVVSPTLRPQGLITRARLLERLSGPVLEPLVRTDATGVSLGKALCSFVSGAPGAGARGQTASLLLVCNEAQDVPPERWDAVFDPMAASTNATTVFMGTVWTGRTLLARQMRYLREQEERDGRVRVFRVPWQRVAEDVPAYGERVRARVAQLGRSHPFVKTEYFLEELDGEGGLFPPEVRARIRGGHAPQRLPERDGVYAMLLDVGGEDREGEPEASGRDATALTIVQVDLSTMKDPQKLAPTYRVVQRRVWTGAGQPELLAELRQTARAWNARRVVVDATGVGAGLAAFLERALSAGTVVQFVFSAASKSELGWSFLNLCSSGRFLDHAPDGSAEQELFQRQMEECEYETLPGPGRRLRWGVSGSTHDDLLLSAALCTVLDGMEWRERVARGRSAG